MKIRLYLVLLVTFVILSLVAFQIYFDTETVAEIENNVDVEKIKNVEDSMIISMHNKIRSCANDYFLGFYKIDEKNQYLKTIDILRSFKNDTYSILPYNPYFVEDRQIDELSIAALKYIKNKTIFFPNPQDFEIIFNLIKNSFSKIKEVGVVIIKNENNEIIYGFSISILEHTSCDKKDVIKILSDLADELESKL